MKIWSINQVPLLFEVLDKLYDSLRRETEDTKYISWNDVAGAKRVISCVHAKIGRG